MLKKTYVLIVLALILLTQRVHSQNMLDIINKYEKAVFTITSFNKDKSINESASGFFISPDGIAIAPGYIFLHHDSIRLTLRNGRQYSISRILSVHKMSNLVMFKANDYRQKGFNYLIPTKNASQDISEVLIFSHPDEAKEGVSLGIVNHVYQIPYLDRVVSLNANSGIKSNGAPVINSRGELIGIYEYTQANNKSQYISNLTLNDSLWVNIPYTQWRKAIFGQQKQLLFPYFNQAIFNFMYENWIEAAKLFTQDIMLNDNSYISYTFRGEARFKYKNHRGCREDFTKTKATNPDYFLLHYYEANNYLSQGKKDEAFDCYVKYIKKHEFFAQALVEFGLLIVDQRKDIETAYKCFSQAIATSPQYANGYYERCRLLKQYFNEYDKALQDINDAINLNHFLPGAYSIRGTFKMQIENFLEAINDFDKAIDIDPNDTHALFNRGISYYNLGMKKNACQDWEKAGQLGHFKSLKFISRYCNGVQSIINRK